MNKAIMQQMALIRPEIAPMVDAALSGNCPFCKKPTSESDCKDPLSLKEFRQSGICQKCQDEFFV